MAFVPLVGELALAVSEVTAELTGSAAAGSAAGSYAAGAASSAAVSSVEDVSKQLLYKIFGQQQVDQAIKDVQSTSNEAKNVGWSIITGQDDFSGSIPDGFGYNSSPQKTHNSDSVPVMPSGKCQDYSSVVENVAKSAVTDLPGMNPSMTNIPIIKKNPAVAPDSKDNASAINQVVSAMLGTPSVTQTDPKKSDPVKLGRDLGTLISVTAGSMISDKNQKGTIDPRDSYSEALQMYPNLVYLVPKILDFSSLVIQPKTDRYNQIYQIYNGRNIDYRKAYFSTNAQGQRTINLANELGQIETWTIDPKGLKLPHLWGNFVGPYSKNDALPIDVLDSFAFFHDIGYQKSGFFSLDDDYKFISRIVQNLDRMGTTESMVAKFSADYFSTIGHTLATYKGSLPDNVATQITNDRTNDDILPKLVDADTIRDPNYPIFRQTFYKSLLDTIDDVSTTSSMGALAPQNVYSTINNQLVIQEIDQLLEQYE